MSVLLAPGFVQQIDEAALQTIQLLAVGRAAESLPEDFIRESRVGGVRIILPPGVDVLDSKGLGKRSEVAVGVDLIGVCERPVEIEDGEFQNCSSAVTVPRPGRTSESVPFTTR